jgi:hypothetical protein
VKKALATSSDFEDFNDFKVNADYQEWLAKKSS